MSHGLTSYVPNLIPFSYLLDLIRTGGSPRPREVVVQVRTTALAIGHEETLPRPIILSPLMSVAMTVPTVAVIRGAIDNAATPIVLVKPIAFSGSKSNAIFGARRPQSLDPDQDQ